MKHVFGWVLLASLAAAGASPAVAVQKCVGPDGKVSFQDAPCADGGGEKLRIRPAAGQAPSDSSAADAQLRLQKMQRDNEMSAAIRTHKPLVGMTVAQLEQAMGLATQVNAANYSGQQHDQVIYERANETWYVYTQNGVVTSVQHKPGPPLGATRTEAIGRCASSLEINNAITSASSMTISAEERTERWKVIKAMQACGK